MLEGLQGARVLIHRLQPVPQDALPLFQGLGKPTGDGEEVMAHFGQWIALAPHVVRKQCVGHRLGSVIHRQHRTYIGMHHKPGQGTKDEIDIVGLLVRTPLRVGDGHNTARIAAAFHRPLHSLDQQAYIASRLGAGGKHDNMVARAHSTRGPAVKSQKRSRRAVSSHLPAWANFRLVQLIAHQIILEIMMLRQGKIHVALAQNFQDFRIAQVVSRRDRAYRLAKCQPPGEQRAAGLNGPHGKSVPFQNGVLKHIGRAFMLDSAARLKPAHSYGHIVARGGEPPGLLKFKFGCLRCLGCHGGLMLAFVS